MGEPSQGSSSARRRERRAVLAEELRAQYPELAEAQEGGKLSEWALAGKNARTLLGKQFPGWKFSVSTKAYSNGSSMNVHWEDLRESEQAREQFAQQVEQALALFAYGRFEPLGGGWAPGDGDRQVAFQELFGSVKYLRATEVLMDDSVRARKRAQASQARLDQALPDPPGAEAPRTGPRL